MKVLVLFALVSLAFSAPQSKKIFHENYEDFLTIIEERVSDEIGQILMQYIPYEEFLQTLDYMNTPNFKNLIYEMEDLPEFKAFIDFLEVHSIDITYFLDRFNSLLENPDLAKRNSRQTASGRDFNSFIRDCIAVLPKAELAALFDQKMTDDEDFRNAIESMESEEFQEIVVALWDSEQFRAEVQTLSENGIDIHVLLEEIVAIFGQN